jgi:hypothetical protein
LNIQSKNIQIMNNFQKTFHPTCTKDSEENIINHILHHVNNQNQTLLNIVMSQGDLLIIHRDIIIMAESDFHE